MNKYQEGKIYKIVCNITNEIYIGSTYRKLNDRLLVHKTTPTCSSREIINRGNYEILLIENYACNNRYELEQRERYYIENNVCINQVIPTRTSKEYYEVNRKKILKEKQTYYINNKQELQKKHKIYRQNNKEAISKRKCQKILCECGSTVSRNHLRRHIRSKKHIEFISNNNK